MNIAIVTINQENAAIASWLAAQDFSGCTLAHWQIEPQPVVAEQVLDALVEQWQRTPADVVLFPPGTFGDELSTRLAWRLHGASICQVTSLDIPTVSVRKSHWGNALTATLQTEKRPLCLSLARQAGAAKNATLPSGMQQLNIVPGALPDWLVSTEDLKNVTRDPLAEARRVLVVGQGGEADNQEIAMLAEKLGAEVGYSRARVMNGGVDAEKVIGISGHLLAPEVCIVVGASGAAALMAGVRNRKFVVAINHDASAAVFSQADVGVVDDWKVVSEALVTNIHADCQ
ncbi:TPA: FAD-binding protein [Escherichia coli]